MFKRHLGDLFIPSRLAGASVGIFSASRQCSHCISRDKTWGGIRFQDLSARGSGCCTVKDYYIKDNMKCLLKEIQRSLVCFLIVGNFHISSAAMTAPTIKWPWNSSPIGAFGDATELPGLISRTEQNLRNSQKRQPSVENESKCCSLPSPRAPKPPTSRDMFLNWTDTLWWHHEEVMYSLSLRGETRPSIFACRDRTVFGAAQYSFILSDRCKFFSFSFFFFFQRSSHKWPFCLSCPRSNAAKISSLREKWRDRPVWC